MYLKTLYRVRGAHEIARVRDLAGGLGVSPGTVSTVLKKLERLHLVDHERYGVVALTESGQRVAECVQRRFETLRDVLIEVFGVDPETAASDACLMEHAVSPVTANAMRAQLQRVRSRASLAAPASEEPCASCAAAGACQAEAGVAQETVRPS